jgi:hypothetical protein
VPPYLTQTDLEVQGDLQHGMHAYGLLRDSRGAGLALCRLTGLPYARRSLLPASAASSRCVGFSSSPRHAA